MITIRIAQSIQDLDAVYAFWYRIYVAEMGRHQDDPLVSHDVKGLFDWMASKGDLMLAEHQSGNTRLVVGTVLTTPVSHPAATKYRDLYQLNDLPSEQFEHSCITTKLMLDPKVRGSRLPARLLTLGYDRVLRAGMHFNYIDCNDHLLPLFERLGYRRHLPKMHHPEYGTVNSMYLPLTDHIHLAQARSPFLKALLRFNEEQGLDSAYIHNTVDDHKELAGVSHG